MSGIGKRLGVPFGILTFPALALISAVTFLRADAPAPFGSQQQIPLRQIARANASPATEPLNFFGSTQADAWKTIGEVANPNAKFIAMERDNEQDVLRLLTRAFTPLKTQVGFTFPANETGKDLGAKGVTYLTFSCRATKAPAMLRLYLVANGKISGSQAAFAAMPGEWQQIYLPTARFGKNSLAKAEGIAFEVVSTDGDTDVQIKNLAAGNTPYTKDSWITHQLSISLNGDWKFRADPKNEGLGAKWSGEDFDDNAWQVIKSGQSWEKQGIATFSGYGWYRQKISVPKDFAGTPLRLTLAHFTGDDEVFLNGTPIGGIKGEFVYENLAVRTYTAPASLVHYGADNTIAIRVWGGNLGFQVRNSGLINGVYTAVLDPYGVRFRSPGGEEQAVSNFDMSAAQQGKPFEIVFRFPGEILKSGAGQLHYNLTDYYGDVIQSGVVPVSPGSDGIARGVVAIDALTSQKIYLRGRLKTDAFLCDASGTPLYCDTDEYGHELEHLDLEARDNLSLPALPDTEEDTPYGKLKLIDKVDCSVPLAQEIHPYMESGFDHAQDASTPGSPIHVTVHDILGKAARESDHGWYAYRIGRGKLVPHTNYLVRFEYAEDKPRYCPVLIEAGEYYMGIGWKNGISPTDPYDNWPLSHQWQWYDAIVSLDTMTLGAGSTGSAPAENGFWVYLINKIVPNGYFSLYQGGPAISRIKLYAIDAVKNAPVIHEPAGLPHRTLMVDWERQPAHNPADLVRYCKLMGYNTVSPVIVKWCTDNYSDPLNGYNTVNVDDCGYWARDMYDLTTHVDSAAPVPTSESIHVRYLEATKQYGLNYVPRVEYGGSYDLPTAARAIDAKGKPAKPNRFLPWSADLLQPAVFDDMSKLIEHLVKPYAQDNPQLTGILWRIRCDRLPISYGPADLQLYASETGTTVPGTSDAEKASWASGAGKDAYDTWWQKKREAFHVKIADQLKSYRPDLTLFYYNWDEDKWSLIDHGLQDWAFLSKVLLAPPGTGTSVYVKDREERAKMTGAQYVDVIHSGNFTSVGKVNRADYALRPDLYKDDKGIQLFAPANQLFFANDPTYLNYFRTADGLAVSNAVAYDEVGYKSINRKYECNMVTPGGSAFSMALEVLACFNGDPRTISYTPYTFGRGFADAHRHFAQAFLALPALDGTVVDQDDPDLKVRVYKTDQGTYIGAIYKGYTARNLSIHLPGSWPANATLVDLVSGNTVPTTCAAGILNFSLDSGPMDLHALVLK